MRRSSDYNDLLLKAFIKESFIQCKRDDLFESKKKQKLLKEKENLNKSMLALERFAIKFEDNLSDLLIKEYYSSKFKNVLLENEQLQEGILDFFRKDNVKSTIGTALLLTILSGATIAQIERDNTNDLTTPTAVSQASEQAQEIYAINDPVEGGTAEKGVVFDSDEDLIKTGEELAKEILGKGIPQLADFYGDKEAYSAALIEYADALRELSKKSSMKYKGKKRKKIKRKNAKKVKKILKQMMTQTQEPPAQEQQDNAENEDPLEGADSVDQYLDDAQSDKERKSRMKKLMDFAKKQKGDSKKYDFAVFDSESVTKQLGKFIADKTSKTFIRNKKKLKGIQDHPSNFKFNDYFNGLELQQQKEFIVKASIVLSNMIYESAAAQAHEDGVDLTSPDIMLSLHSMTLEGGYDDKSGKDVPVQREVNEMKGSQYAQVIQTASGVSLKPSDIDENVIEQVKTKGIDSIIEIIIKKKYNKNSLAELLHNPGDSTYKKSNIEKQLASQIANDAKASSKAIIKKILHNNIFENLNIQSIESLFNNMQAEKSSIDSIIGTGK